MAKSPIWRATFAKMSETVDSQVHRLLDSEAVAVAIGLAHTVQRDVTKRTERASSRVWHALNLPTGSDINRLLVQLGSVEREIRVLEKRFDATPQSFGDGDTTGSDREVILGARAHRSDRGPRPRPS